MKIRHAVAFGLGLMALVPLGAQADWAPSKPVEIIMGAGAGGQVDTLGRALTAAFEKFGIVEQPLTPVNKPGSGFQVAIAYANNHEGDAHYVNFMGASWISTALMTNKPETFDNLTVVAKLFDTPMLYVVKADSPLKDAKDLAEAMKADPGSVRFAISTVAGNDNHLSVLRFAEAAGADPRAARVVVNDSGSISMTQLLGGHIEVCVCSAGSMKALLADGSVRALGLVRDDRIMDGEAASIPTLAEQGYPVSLSAFYQLALPKGASEEQVLFWEAAVQKALESEDVKKVVADLNLVIDFRPHDEMSAFIDENRKTMMEKLKEFGFVQ